jgi:predicted esterase
VSARKLRVLFIHGQEGSPQGSKARALAAAFDTRTPAMDTKNLEACVAQQAEAVRRFEPDVVVGSSYGAAVAVALLQREQWDGPTLLLAQAAQQLGLRGRLPRGVRVWLVHATGDDVVPVDDARKLARSGTQGLVRLVEVEDDHALHAFVASGRLVAMVEELAAAQASPADEGSRVGRFERFLSPFFEEPTLWPVTLVLGAHALLGGAVVLAMALRARNAFALAALALLVVMTADVLFRCARARRMGRIGWGLVALWIGSALGAVLATRFDFF